MARSSVNKCKQRANIYTGVLGWEKVRTSEE